jgi:non-ribosomal peptide synthetase component F
VVLLGADAETRTPWLGQYDLDVPSSLAPYPHKTLVDVVHETAIERPGHIALIFNGAQVTYGDLDPRTDALARVLHERGVMPGDRVALLLPNSPQAVIAHFGAWKAGAIVAPLNPLYTEYEHGHSQSAPRTNFGGHGALVGALNDRVSSVSCVSSWYPVNAAETH